MFRLIFKKVASVFFIFQNIFSLSQLGLKVLKIYLLYGQWWSGSCKNVKSGSEKKVGIRSVFFTMEKNVRCGKSNLLLRDLFWICIWQFGYRNSNLFVREKVQYLNVPTLGSDPQLCPMSAWLVWPPAVPYTWVCLGWPSPPGWSDPQLCPIHESV